MLLLTVCTRTRATTSCRRRSAHACPPTGGPIHQHQTLRAANGQSCLADTTTPNNVDRAGPARARFTLRLMLETLLRRPQAFKEACSFAVTHLAMSEYMERLERKLDAAIEKLESDGPRKGTVLRNQRKLKGQSR